MTTPDLLLASLSPPAGQIEYISVSDRYYVVKNLGYHLHSLLCSRKTVSSNLSPVSGCFRIRQCAPPLLSELINPENGDFYLVHWKSEYVLAAYIRNSRSREAGTFVVVSGINGMACHWSGYNITATEYARVGAAFIHVAREVPNHCAS